MADAQIKAVITADDRASSVVAGFGSSFTKMAGAVAAGMAIFEGLKRVTGGLIDIFTDSIHAFMQAENAQVRLKGAIKNVTSASNHNVDGLLKQAAALQKVTRFSDDQIVSAQGILATFQLNQEQIKTFTPRLIDMSEGLARATGEMPDLEANANLVAKALGGEDTDSMVGALRRANIFLTTHQTEILKTGTFQERLAAITKILDQNVGGLGLTMGQTASAKFLQLQFAINDLQEQLGAALFDAVKPFIATLTQWAASDQARAVMKQIADKVVELGKAFFEFIKNNWPTIKGTFVALFEIAKVIGPMIMGIGSAMAFSAKIFKTSVAVLSAPFKLLYDLLKLIDGLFNKVVTQISSKEGTKFIGDLGKLGVKPAGVRAMGGPVSGGMPYLVGERGPELFVPNKSGDIVPNGAGSTINLSVNVGIYAGTQLEKRKLAETLLKSMKDIASSRNQTLGQMIS